nr:CSS-motif domain-containing protein [uncultured Pseudomonas sp.]
MSRTTTIGRSMLELLLILSISLIPVASGLAVMVYQQDRKLEENARVSVQEAIYSVDLSLDRLHAIANNALALAGKPCAEAKVSLTKLATETQYLRSLTLAEGGEAYCSSMAGFADAQLSQAGPSMPVQLAFISTLAPEGALLVHQVEHEAFSAIATAYADQLRNELRAFQDGLTLLLQFGDGYIWADGDSRDLSRPSQAEYFHRGISEKYGYTVEAGYAEGFSANEARQSMLMVLPSLVLIGVVTGSVIYWALFRRGPRNENAANSR